MPKEEDFLLFEARLVDLRHKETSCKVRLILQEAGLYLPIKITKNSQAFDLVRIGTDGIVLYAQKPRPVSKSN